MSRAGLLEPRVAGVGTGPSYLELLLDTTSQAASVRSMQGERVPQAVLLRRVASWLERSPELASEASHARRADVITFQGTYPVVIEANISFG